MTIKQNLVNNTQYALKCPHIMSPIGICVHNTANDATAKQESAYIVNNPASKDTSYHFAVDDVEAYQNLPLDRNGWHAGDGANGEGNRKHIAIEICYSKSGGEKFAKAEENTAELIAQLLKERNWGIERVKKHQDFSGKYCPHRTLDLGWDKFINMVKVKMGGSMADMTISVSDFERLRKASERGDKVLKESGVLNKNIADATDQEITEVIAKVKKTADDLTNITTHYEAQKDFVKRLMTNSMALSELLGLGTNGNPDQIYLAVKALKDQSNQTPTQPGTPDTSLPETKTVNGRAWGLNGLTIDSEGKMVGNYKRND
jgi:N-acetylmuramoyl-L-alanine amidase CwlA